MADITAPTPGALGPGTYSLAPDGSLVPSTNSPATPSIPAPGSPGPGAGPGTYSIGPGGVLKVESPATPAPAATPEDSELSTFQQKTPQQLADDRYFDYVGFGARHKLSTDPLAMRKLAQVARLRNEKPTDLLATAKDIGAGALGVGNAVLSAGSGLFDFAKAQAGGVQARAEGAGGTRDVTLSNGVTVQLPVRDLRIERADASGKELRAAVESSAISVTDTARKFVRWIGDHAGQLVGTAVGGPAGTAVAKAMGSTVTGRPQDDQGWEDRIRTDIAAREVLLDAMKGEGVVSQQFNMIEDALTGRKEKEAETAALMDTVATDRTGKVVQRSVEELKEAGILADAKVDPQNAEQLQALTDLIAYWGVFKGLGMLGQGVKNVAKAAAAPKTTLLPGATPPPVTVAPMVERATEASIRGGLRGAGATAETVGKGVETLGRRSQSAGGAAAIATALMSGNLGKAAMAALAPTIIRYGGKTLAALGSRMTKAAVSGAPGDVARMGVTQALSPHSLLTAGAFAVGEDDPAIAAHAFGGGVGFAGMFGLKSDIARGSKFWGNKAIQAAGNKASQVAFERIAVNPVDSPAYSTAEAGKATTDAGTTVDLDSFQAIHNAQMGTAKVTGARQNWINWFREFLRPSTRYFVVDGPTFEAQTGQKSAGLFYEPITLADGTKKALVLINADAKGDAIAHEPGHLLFYSTFRNNKPVAVAFLKAIADEYGAEGVERYRKQYEADINADLPAGATPVVVPTEKAMMEMAAELISSELLGGEWAEVNKPASKGLSEAVLTLMEAGSGFMEVLGMDRPWRADVQVPVGQEAATGATATGIQPSMRTQDAAGDLANVFKVSPDASLANLRNGLDRASRGVAIPPIPAPAPAAPAPAPAPAPAAPTPAPAPAPAAKPSPAAPAPAPAPAPTPAPAAPAPAPSPKPPVSPASKTPVQTELDLFKSPEVAAPAPAPAAPAPVAEPPPSAPAIPAPAAGGSAQPPAPATPPPPLAVNPGRSSISPGARGPRKQRTASDDSRFAAALAWAEKERPDLVDTLRELDTQLGNLVTIDYASVKGDPTAPAGQRKGAQQAAYDVERAMPWAKEAETILSGVGSPTRELFLKKFIPIRWQVRTDTSAPSNRAPGATEGTPEGAKDVNLLAFSLDKFVVNADRMIKAAAANPKLTEALKMNPEGDILDANGQVSESTWKWLYNALDGYTRNQNNGWKGDGSGMLVVPEGFRGNVPEPVPEYRPVVLDSNEANFINLLMGGWGTMAPPVSGRLSAAKESIVGDTKFVVERARPTRNKETMAEEPANIRVGELAMATDPSRVSIANVPGGNTFAIKGDARPILEFNPMRAEVVKALGVPEGRALFDKLHGVMENLNLEGISKASIRGEATTLQAPVTDVVRAGFMPEGRTAEGLDLARAAADRSSGDWMTYARSLDQSKGGFTAEAYKVGDSARTAGDVAGLIRRREKSKADSAAIRARLMEAKKTGNTEAALPLFDEMSAEGNRTQYFNEAIERATGSEPSKIDGYRRLTPDYQPPVPMDKAALADLTAMVLASPEKLSGEFMAGERKGDPGKIGGQFLPSERSDTEIIRAAALRMPDGRLFTGMMHDLAADHARDAGIVIEAKGDTRFMTKGKPIEEGFYTSEGRFVNREEAFKIGEAAGQLRREVADAKLDTDDVGKWGGEFMAGERRPEQQFTSAGTSINKAQLPYTARLVTFKPGTRNVDIGGGKFDNFTEELSRKGVKNIVLDPYNRTEEQNAEAQRQLDTDGPADTATVNNVLNVIKEPAARDAVIKQAYDSIVPGGTAYFHIYQGFGEAKGTGVGKETRPGDWQENRKTATYMGEIAQHFDTVTRKGNLIIATKGGPRSKSGRPIEDLLDEAIGRLDYSKKEGGAEYENAMDSAEDMLVRDGIPVDQARALIDRHVDGYSNSDNIQQAVKALSSPLTGEFMPAERVTPAVIDKEVKSDEGYVYHATNSDRLQEIADSGKLNVFKPSYGTDQRAWPDGSTEKRAYFSPKAEVVWQFAPEDGKPVIVRAKDTADIGKESTGDRYSNRPIDAAKLEYLGTDKKWHPVKDMSRERDESRLIGGEFLPSNRSDAEVIKSAAVRTPEGDVFTGLMHGLARERFGEERNLPASDMAALEMGEYPGLVEGFVTSAGRFVDRQEAFKIGMAAGQVAPDNSISREGESLISENLVDLPGSTDFMPSGRSAAVRKAAEEATPDLLSPAAVPTKVGLGERKAPSEKPELQFPEQTTAKQARNKDGSPKRDSKGRPVYEGQPWDFEGAPPLKKMPRDQKIDWYVNKLVSEATEAMKRPELADGKTWYSDVREALKKALPEPKEADLFAKLLAATSPQQGVELNFRDAVESYNQFHLGRYDDLIRVYKAGRTLLETGDLDSVYVRQGGIARPSQPSQQATYDRQLINWWIDTHGLTPTKSNGKEFAGNSGAVLEALTGYWEGGQKTRQFYENMMGQSFEATIDSWASRTLRRLGYEGSVKKWRIHKDAELAPSEAEFDFAQEVFRKAADKMGDGWQPDALQAVIWFAEKMLWGEKGWTSHAGKALSSFKIEFDKLAGPATKENRKLEIVSDGQPDLFGVTPTRKSMNPEELKAQEPGKQFVIMPKSTKARKAMKSVDLGRD